MLGLLKAAPGRGEPLSEGMCNLLQIGERRELNLSVLQVHSPVRAIRVRLELAN